MSETRFTKGEWKVERFVNNKGFEISFNDDGEVVADHVYTEPDAHLIAAAPEMYAMLQEILDGGSLHRMDAKAISDLLAKARGE